MDRTVERLRILAVLASLFAIGPALADQKASDWQWKEQFKVAQVETPEPADRSDANAPAGPEPEAMEAEEEVDAADVPADEMAPATEFDPYSAESILQEISEFVSPPETGVSEIEKAAEERMKAETEGMKSVGQVRTQWGTIDLNQISLDELYDALDTQSARDEVRITLENCIFLALDQNQDIRIAEYGPLKVDGDILSAKGEFDPTLTSTISYSESETSASSQTQSFLGGGLGGGGGIGSLLGGLGGITSALGLDSVLGIGGGGALVIESETLNIETGVRGKLPTGTQYDLKLAITRDEGTFSNFEPEFNGGGTFTLTQPILRGAGFNYNLVRVRTAKNNRISSEYRLRQQVEQSLSEVMRAYWDLVGAQEQLDVRRQSLENAQRLRKNNERRLELGQIAASEVISAKASEATRLSDLVAARNQVAGAEDRLKLLINMRDETGFNTARLVPVDRPMPEELNLDEPLSVEKAMANRVELLSNDVDIDNAELDILRKRNEMLPQLDLQASYYRGARGPEWKIPFEGITDRRDTTWSAGLQASVPIPNRQARGAYYSSKVSKLQTEQQRQKTIDDIIISVKNAIRNTATSRVQLEANRQARALQETNVEAEEKKQRLGISTSFEVLRVQEDLANAQVAEVQSMIDLEKAFIELSLAEGTLMQDFGVQFEMPEKEKPVSFIRSITPGVSK